MILLQTSRLLLRTHDERDEPAFVEMHTDPEVRRYVGGRAWSIDEAITRFRARFLGEPRTAYGLWAAVLEAEDVYVGMCGLSGPPQRAAHLGYYIARPYWGLGLATEAARAFVDFGFGNLQLRRILADADEGNRASERILEKLGFRAIREEALASGRVICHFVLERQNSKAVRGRSASLGRLRAQQAP
jgi:[ribosomal protein S5]-alanine N-acetyltransferase